LSAGGRAAAARLAGWPGWAGVTLVASSPEPKAVDTATPVAAALAVELSVEDDLREARRRQQPPRGRADYVRAASGYLRGDPVEGWEPAADVRRRVSDCIERLVATAPGDVAVVSHGLALSLYLGLEPEEWERIALPALAVVEPETRRVLEPWTSPD
jgi:broad specificity phosphatase PhoE